jgi:ABC-type branched-subunit amino acid transport system ATPase component/ABC-type branched-subunit amino acid transport system permease subunit
LLGYDIPLSVIVLGVISGMTYGLLSVGLLIVYRSNRVINFAHGEIGAFAAAVFGLGANTWHLPYYLNLPIALAVGAAVGAGAEVAVIRRLRSAPRLMSIVATLGVGQFLVALAKAINTQAGAALIFPEPPGLPVLTVGALRITPSYTGTLFFAPVVVGALALFLRFGRFGLAMRGAAANPEAARMAGVNSARMSSLAWAIAGALSTFTAILVFPTIGLATGSSFGPGLLLRALVGAVIARMSSLPVALAGGVGLGVVEGVLLHNNRHGGLVEVTLFVIILVALLLQRGERSRDRDSGSAWAAVQPWRRLPEEIAALPSVRRLGPAIAVACFAVLAMLPLLTRNTTSITMTAIIAFAIVALSVGLITGLGGQLSLGQFALGAIGATASYVVASHTSGNPVAALFAGGLAAAAISVIVGLPALRISGLLLTVTTLAFAVVVPTWLLQQTWMLGDGVDPGRPVVLGRTLAGGHSYYLFSLVVLALILLLARNVRTTGLGRLLIAIRDNEENARAFGVPARRLKLQAFGLAGFVAGVGGAVYAHTFSRISGGTFLTEFSIRVVVMTVVGGVAILAGPLLGAILVLGVPAFVPLDAAGLAATSFGLLLVILYAPGGLAQLIGPLRQAVTARLAARSGVRMTEDGGDAPREMAEFHIRAEPRGERPQHGGVLLEVAEVRKRFGGVVALNDVCIQVLAGETVGLIGPNGAGKTTLFEVIGGFTGCDGGHVLLSGSDVTGSSPEALAKLGLIRSFQDASLFSTMSVLETVQLALERSLPTTFLASVAGVRDREKRKEATAREIVGSMGLWAYRSKPIQELSTGTRRITELACMVALSPSLLLLDEPSSGIAQRETEALGELLADLKVQLDLTMLIIEHDMPLVMGLADRIVAMDSGSVIATGSPDAIQDDPAVIESYLGGRPDAIERSGAPSGPDPQARRKRSGSSAGSKATRASAARPSASVKKVSGQDASRGG